MDENIVVTESNFSRYHFALDVWQMGIWKEWRETVSDKIAGRHGSQMVAVPPSPPSEKLENCVCAVQPPTCVCRSCKCAKFSWLPFAAAAADGELALLSHLCVHGGGEAYLGSAF